MRMKEDAMKNGQLKPAYNLQYGVEASFIVWLGSMRIRRIQGHSSRSWKIFRNTSEQGAGTSSPMQAMRVRRTTCICGTRDRHPTSSRTTTRSARSASGRTTLGGVRTWCILQERTSTYVPRANASVRWARAGQRVRADTSVKRRSMRARRAGGVNGRGSASTATTARYRWRNG